MIFTADSVLANWPFEQIALLHTKWICDIGRQILECSIWLGFFLLATTNEVTHCRNNKFEYHLFRLFHSEDDRSETEMWITELLQHLDEYAVRSLQIRRELQFKGISMYFRKISTNYESRTISGRWHWNRENEKAIFLNLYLPSWQHYPRRNISLWTEISSCS